MPLAFLQSVQSDYFICKSRLTLLPRIKAPSACLADKWASGSVAPSPTHVPSSGWEVLEGAMREAELGGVPLVPADILCFFLAGGSGGRALYPPTDLQFGREIKGECLGHQDHQCLCSWRVVPPSAGLMSARHLYPLQLQEGLGLPTSARDCWLPLRPGTAEALTPKPH